MTKKDKGENLKRVKEKALKQLIIVKERKGGKMVASRRGQHRRVRKRVKGREEERGCRKKPLQRKGIIFFFVPR
jgi:hypothetical protein